MKIPLTKNFELVFHRSALREPIDAVRRRLDLPVQPRERTTFEALRPMELRRRQPPPQPGTSAANPPRHGRFGFENPEPSTDIELDVVDIRQQKINACGDAVINIMLAYHRMPHSTAGSNDRRLFQGLHPHELGNISRRKAFSPSRSPPPRQASSRWASFLNGCGVTGPSLRIRAATS